VATKIYPDVRDKVFLKKGKEEIPQIPRGNRKGSMLKKGVDRGIPEKVLVLG